MLTKPKDFLACAALCAIFFLTLTWIHPEYGADPLSYSNEALIFLRQRGVAETRGLLEFGHLIWRPLAAAGAALSSPLITRLSGIEPELAPLVILITLNVIFTLLGVLLVYRIARVLSGSVTAGIAVALIFLTTNAVLTYIPSGYPYATGTAMQLLGVSIIVAPPLRIRSLWLRALITGIALAASVCLWAPFVVSIPGIIALAFVWRESGLPLRERAHFARQTALWALLAGGIAFGTAVWLNDFQSFGEIAQWVRASSHEWAQTHRLVRLITGLPRSLIAVQDESLLLKRLYFHDPYAPVRWSRVLGGVAWKPPLFALGISALGWMLVRSEAGRRLLIAALCCWIPLVVFSVAVFEPSSPERFLPGFALLFAGVAYAAKKVSWRDSASWLLGGFFAVMVALNLSSVSPAAAQTRNQNAIQRLDFLRPAWHANSLAVLLSYRDGIFAFEYAEPFNHLSRIPFHFLDAVEPGTQRASSFRQEFAAAALNAWQQGGDVWISRRLIAARPQPEWDWVEGDNSGVRWQDLRNYYSRFETDAQMGGEDGFLRVSASEANRVLLIADGEQEQAKLSQSHQALVPEQ